MRVPSARPGTTGDQTDRALSGSIGCRPEKASTGGAEVCDSTGDSTSAPSSCDADGLSGVPPNVGFEESCAGRASIPSTRGCHDDPLGTPSPRGRDDDGLPAVPCCKSSPHRSRKRPDSLGNPLKFSAGLNPPSSATSREWRRCELSLSKGDPSEKEIVAAVLTDFLISDLLLCLISDLKPFLTPDLNVSDAPYAESLDGRACFASPVSQTS